jgi:hypothetical protein
MLHCEDASIVTTAQERMMAEGRGALARLLAAAGSGQLAPSQHWQ